MCAGGRQKSRCCAPYAGVLREHGIVEAEGGREGSGRNTVYRTQDRWMIMRDLPDLAIGHRVASTTVLPQPHLRAGCDGAAPTPPVDRAGKVLAEGRLKPAAL